MNSYKSACDKYIGSAGVNKNNTKVPNSTEGPSCGPTVMYTSSPLSLAKAVKNEAELEGMRNSHLR